MNFRKLKASEIDVRIAMVKPNGLSLLLYKDARVDQNILDETVGSMNWQRHHCRENANCIVAIWDADKKQWIEKEDTGTESYTEKEKGIASDSFKRACFNWGIGRELYTAPFIWVNSTDCSIKDGKCFDRFSVKSIGYDKNGNIDELVIENTTLKRVVFNMASKTKGQEPISKVSLNAIRSRIAGMTDKTAETEEWLCKKLNVPKLETLPRSEMDSAINLLNQLEAKKND